MAYDPQPGDVIRYDFLWKVEEQRGRLDGAKDRPCAIVLTTQPQTDGSRQVVVVPITHTPPSHSEVNQSIEIPKKVGRHLGLDNERSWIRTDQVNLFTWEQGRVPAGLVPTPDKNWKYGSLPDALNKQVVQEVHKQSLKRTLMQVNRKSR